MQHNFETVFEHLIGSEGGYGNDPLDLGGPTKYGVTIADLRDWRHDQTLTANDVKLLPLSEAKDIFKARYWDLCKGNELPDGLDYAVTDYAYNSGNGRAVKALQTQLGELYTGRVDGVMGPRSIAACNKIADMQAFINTYQDNRQATIQTFSAYWKFGKGWTTRVKEVREASLKLASLSVTSALGAGTAGAVAASLPPLTPMDKPTIADTTRVQSTSKAVAQVTTISAIGTFATDSAQQLAPHASALPLIKYVCAALVMLGSVVGLYLLIRKMNAEG
jgi:lysozyme family protein